MKLNIYILSATLLLSSCSYLDNNEFNNPLSRLETRDVLKATPVADFGTWNIENPGDLIKQGNIIAVGNRTEHHNVSIINLATREKQDWIARGRGAGEVADISGLSCTDGVNITALDFYSGQLWTATTTPTLTRSHAIATLQLPAGCQHLIAAQTDRFVISTGVYEKGRYQLYSLEDGSVNYFLPYPEHPEYPELDNFAKSILYASSVLRVRPDQQAFACVDIHSGLIDICRIEGNRIERIKQHCYYSPRIAASGKSKTDIHIAYTKENPYGFRDVAVTNDHIYVLYSGRTRRTDHYDLSQCRTILVFDWNGNQVKSYELETPASHICYDETEKALYGIGFTPGATLVKYNL